MTTSNARGAPRRDEQQAPPPAPFGRGGHMRFGGKVEKAKDRRGTLRRLWGYLRRQRAALIATVFIVAAITGLNLAGPYLLGVAIDRYILPGDLPGLMRIALLMLATYAAASLLTWLQIYIMTGAAQHTVRDLRNDLFGKLQVLPLRFFDARPHGELMSRLTNDIENVNTVLADSVSQLVSGILGLVGVVVVMVVLNPRLAAVSLVAIPGMVFLLNRWLSRRTRTGFRKQQAALGKLNGMIEETITGQRVVVAYGREQATTAEFEVSNQELRRAATEANIFVGFAGPSMNMISNLGLAIVAGAGGWMAVAGLATVGTVASFINYARQLSRPLNEVAVLYNSIQSALAGAERISRCSTRRLRPMLWVAQGTCNQRLSPATSCSRISPSPYEPDIPVLQNVSLHAPGQVVALVEADRREQDGDRPTCSALLRDRARADHHRRPAHPGVPQGGSAPPARHRPAGLLLVHGHGDGQYPRPARRERRRGDVAAARLADQFIHRLPHGYQTPLSGAAATSTRASASCSPSRGRSRGSQHPDPRRGDRQRGHAHRAPHPGGHAPPDGRPHQLRHCAPAQHDSQHRTRSW